MNTVQIRLKSQRALVGIEESLPVIICAGSRLS